MKTRTQATANFYLYKLEAVRLFGRTIHYELFVNNVYQGRVLPSGDVVEKNPNGLRVNVDRVRRELAAQVG